MLLHQNSRNQGGFVRKFILTTIIAFVAISGLYGQEKDTAQVEPKIRLELIYKKELGEMMVGPEGFPPPEIKQVLQDKDIPQEDKDWLLNSLRIEIARREKVLYTNDRKAIRLPDDLQSITTSQNLKYMIVYAAHTDYGGMTREQVKKLRDDWLDAYKRCSQWQTKWERESEKKIPEYRDSMHYWLKISDSLNELLREVTMRKKKEYKIFIMMQTEDGKVLWEKNEGDRYYIFDDGVVSIVNAAEIKFYNKKGNLITVYSIAIQGVLRDVNLNGDFIALLSGGSNESYTMLLNKTKGKIWEKEFSLPFYPAQILISSKSERILISVDTMTYLYSTSGELIKVFPHWINHFSFSHDGKYFALLDPSFLEICESSNGNILGKWHKERKNQGLWRCQVTSESPIVFVTSTKDVKVLPYEDVILLFDQTGQITTQQELHKGSDVSIASLNLSPNDKYFLCKIGLSFYGLFKVIRGVQ